MERTKIFLLLGGNVGDRLQWLEEGRKAITNHIGAITRASGIYETAAWGKEDQPSFLNQVVEVKTALTALDVLQAITAIELHTAGRIRTQKWAARTLDIDILFYGDEVLNREGLIIPHPHLQDRRFALVSLCEIAPDLLHPLLGLTSAALLQACTDPLTVTLLQTQAAAL